MSYPMGSHGSPPVFGVYLDVASWGLVMQSKRVSLLYSADIKQALETSLVRWII